MPKVKWGGKELQERLEEYEGNGSGDYTPYDGPEPVKGMYGWTITRMEQTTSSGGFGQLIVHLELDPRDRTDHKQYAGFYMRDYVIVKEDGSTDFRVRPLLNALGVSVRDFLNNTIVGAKTGETKDGAGIFPVTKIGKLTIGGNKVLGNIWRKRGEEYFKISFHPPKNTDAGAAGDDDAGNDTDGDEPPF